MRHTLVFTVTTVLFIISLFTSQCDARSSRYYDMVNDISAKVNYYQLLGVNKDSPPGDIRKAFRQLALTLHPDKAGPDSEAAYLLAVRANEALSDPESKKEYDDLLNNGVPWHENYYGKYAHEYGAPDHDIRYVLFGLVTFISVFQYFYQLNKHHTYQRLARKNPRYQNKLQRIQSTKAPKGRFEDDDDEDEPGVQIMGAEKPKLQNVFAVTLLLSPYYIATGTYFICKKIYREVVLGQKPTTEEMEAQVREKMGMNEEEWEEHKRLAQAKQEKFKASAKYKRMVRFMKKR